MKLEEAKKFLSEGKAEVQKNRIPLWEWWAPKDFLREMSVVKDSEELKLDRYVDERIFAHHKGYMGRPGRPYEVEYPYDVETLNNLTKQPSIDSMILKFSIDKGVDEGTFLSKFDNGKLVEVKKYGEKDDK